MKLISLKLIMLVFCMNLISNAVSAQSAAVERVKIGKSTMYKKDCTTNSKAMTCTLCEDSNLKQKCQKYTRKPDGTYVLASTPQPNQSARVKKPIKVKEDPDGGGEVTSKK